MMGMNMKQAMKPIVHVGIISKENYQKRTIAIARGEYVPQPEEPKIWFESFHAMAKVLSNRNQELLKTIIEQHPESITALQHLTGRPRSSLSETLHLMERYGIVELQKEKGAIKPIVKATDFRIEFSLCDSFCSETL